MAEGTKHNIGDKITLKASPAIKNINGIDYEYIFKGWYLNGELQSMETTYEITVINDATYIAVFELESTLIYYTDGTIDAINQATLEGYENNVNIERVEIGSLCTKIGQYAFRGCSNLEEIKALGGNCITIYGGAFGNNENLRKVNLPNVNFQENIAWFGSCTALQEVTFGSIGHPITTLPWDTFYNCTQTGLTIKIYVASGTTSLANQPWGATKATIEYYDSTTGERIN